MAVLYIMHLYRRAYMQGFVNKMIANGWVHSWCLKTPERCVRWIRTVLQMSQTFRTIALFRMSTCGLFRNIGSGVVFSLLT